MHYMDLWDRWLSYEINTIGKNSSNTINCSKNYFGDLGISRACAHLLLCEWHMSSGLTFPCAHCYNTVQCAAAVAAMPSVVPLLLLGEGIIGKLKKRNRQTDTERQLQLLATPIRLVAPMSLICFFDGTKWEMIVINCLPYQVIQTEVEGYWIEAL